MTWKIFLSGVFLGLLWIFSDDLSRTYSLSFEGYGAVSSNRDTQNFIRVEQNQIGIRLRVNRNDGVVISIPDVFMDCHLFRSEETGSAGESMRGYRCEWAIESRGSSGWYRFVERRTLTSESVVFPTSSPVSFRLGKIYSSAPVDHQGRQASRFWHNDPGDTPSILEISRDRYAMVEVWKSTGKFANRFSWSFSRNSYWTK